MSFYVYGRNAKTGEVLHRYLSHTATSAEARAEAKARGVEVTAIVIADNETDAKKAGLRTGTDAAEQSRPWATYALIAINALLYFARLPLSGGFWQADDETLLHWGASYGPLTASHEWWRLLTASFVHDGLPEIVVYMLALALVGATAECFFGALGFLLIYVACAVTGNLSALWLDLQGVHAGALGAVSGIFGALLVLGLLPNKKEARAAFEGIPAMGSLLLTICAFLFGEVGREIGWLSLIGGLLCGFVCGSILASGESQTPNPLRFALTICVVGAIVGTLATTTHRRANAFLQTQVVLEAATLLDKRVDAQLADARAEWKKCRLSDAQARALIEKDILPDWRQLRTRLQEIDYSAELARKVDSRLDHMRDREAALESSASIGRKLGASSGAFCLNNASGS